MPKNPVQKIKQLLKLERSSPIREADRIIWLLPNGNPHRIYGPAVEAFDGSKEWLQNGKLHREDGPAIIYADGSKEFWLKGEQLMPLVFSEQKKMAQDPIKQIKKLLKIERSVPIKELDRTVWMLRGKVHRDFGPAIIHSEGTKAWYFMGQCCREDGPAILYPDGSFQWFNKNGKRHRVGGPAFACKNQREWWVNGKLHRTDGPAVKYVKNSTPDRYFIKGKELTKEEFYEKHPKQKR